ncbi:MAG: hypothetical protein NTX29_09465 [Actinobacteria bacterium]|nr:hypothetical protein [Actinomycetota bacterium]
MSVDPGTAVLALSSGLLSAVSYLARRIAEPPPEYMRSSPDWAELRLRYLLGRLFPIAFVFFGVTCLVLLIEVIRSG